MQVLRAVCLHLHLVAHLYEPGYVNIESRLAKTIYSPNAKIKTMLRQGTQALRTVDPLQQQR